MRKAQLLTTSIILTLLAAAPSVARAVESLDVLEERAHGCTQVMGSIQSKGWYALIVGLGVSILACCALWLVSQRWVRWPWAQLLIVVASVPVVSMIWLVFAKNSIAAELDYLPSATLRQIIEHPAFASRPGVGEACMKVISLQEAALRDELLLAIAQQPLFISIILGLLCALVALAATNYSTIRTR